MENENVIVEESTTGNGKKKGSGNKARKMLVIAIVLVIVMITGATQAAAMTNAVAKLFKNPTEYYQYVETKNAEKTVEGIATAYENIFKEGLKFDRSGKTEVSLNIGKDAMALLEMVSDADLEFLENIGIAANANSKDDVSQVDYSITVGKKALVTAEAIFDLKEGMAYARVPQLTENYLSMELDELLELMETGMDTDDIREILDILEEVSEKTPDKKKVEKILNKYIELIISCVEDVEEEEEMLSAGDAAKKYTKLTITLDEDLLKDAMELVLETMEKDKELEKIIVEAFTIKDISDGEEVYEEFNDAVSDLLDEVEDLSTGDEEIEMCIWVDRNGSICGRSFTYESDYDSFGISYAVVWEGKKIGIEVEAEADGVKVRLAGTGTLKDGKIAGEMDLKVAGIKMAKVTFEDVEVGKDSFAGSFVLTPSKELAETLVEEIPMDVDDIGLQLDVKTEKNQSSVTVSLLLDDEVFAGITVATEYGDGKKVSIPKEKNCTEVEDEYDLLDYVSDMDADALLEDMEDAGIPDEFIEEIEDFFDLIG